MLYGTPGEPIVYLLSLLYSTSTVLTMKPAKLECNDMEWGGVDWNRMESNQIE
jgi:hypothetical protein